MKYIFMSNVNVVGAFRMFLQTEKRAKTATLYNGNQCQNLQLQLVGTPRMSTVSIGCSCIMYLSHISRISTLIPSALFIETVSSTNPGRACTL